MDLTAVIKQFRLLFYDIKLLLEFTCVWWWYIPLEQYHWSVGRTREIYFVSKIEKNTAVWSYEGLLRYKRNGNNFSKNTRAVH